VQEHGTALVDALELAIPRWVVRSVERLLVAFHGHADARALDAARTAGDEASGAVSAAVRELLERDIDDQLETPLTIVRRVAVPYATEVLRAAGVPPVVRDDFKERSFPDDDYDLTPAGWADIDDSVQAPGMAWGAWKAMTYKARHTA
jgi:hypothetical protein